MELRTFGTGTYTQQLIVGMNTFSFNKEKKHYCKNLLAEQLVNYEKMMFNKKLALSTYVGYKKIIENQLIPTFGDYSIKDITPAVIIDWVNGLSNTRGTIKKKLQLLKVMFDDSLNNNIINDNPFDKIAIRRLLKISSKQSDYEIEPFNLEEMGSIIESALGQFKNLIQFAFYSGLRTSELISLKWKDIDFKQEIINVNTAKVHGYEKEPKTKSGIRKVQMLSKAKEALLKQIKYTDNSSYVFHNPNTSREWASSEVVSKCWKKLLSSVKVKYRNCYQMRHTYCSMLVSNGENLAWVASQMGHENTELVIKVYGKWLPDNNEYELKKKL
jgi:integrase